MTIVFQSFCGKRKNSNWKKKLSFEIFCLPKCVSREATTKTKFSYIPKIFKNNFEQIFKKKK